MDIRLLEESDWEYLQDIDPIVRMDLDPTTSDFLAVSLKETKVGRIQRKPFPGSLASNTASTSLNPGDVWIRSWCCWSHARILSLFQAIMYVAISRSTWLPHSAILYAYGTAALARLDHWQPISVRSRFTDPGLGLPLRLFRSFQSPLSRPRKKGPG